MSVFSVRRRIPRKLAAQIELLEQARREIVAAAARLLQPTAALIPIRVVVDRQTRARRRD